MGRKPRCRAPVRLRLNALPLLLIPMHTLAVPVAAQSVLGRAVDGSSGAPVEGVLVELIDSIGQNRRETLTDSTGWFFPRPDGSGTYSVRGSALGYAPIASDPFELALAEQIELEITVETAPIPSAFWCVQA